ncbi:uncharacterized protein LOC128958448 [Oppia nitens]|uniref:uncharacterized protein LOC128958448 n=1 Tax=Oppia nitens TaxID=1686743 RepID=UPI0023DAAC98|nr:uncharacterized protein LOC128958448 [Oppia nitens]
MNSLNSLTDSLMDTLSHIVKGSVELIRHPKHITDLDEHSFHHMLRYLPLTDVFVCRQVSRFFLRQADSFLENCHHLTYGCRLNGVHISNGEYVFNGQVFDYVVSKMPNIRVMKFAKCPEMRFALATTNYDIIFTLTNHLVMLNELHITRCRALDMKSIKLLVDWFPNMTHLTVSVYNETSLEIITKGLANLKYFNLDDSVLDNYGNHLQLLGLKIHTFIAAADHNNHKTSIIDGLLNGNGRDLQVLDLRIKVFDCDQQLFDRIGKEFSELTSLKIVLQSRRTVRNNALLAGLSQLTHLKQLHIEETKRYKNFHSVFDDNSILIVIKNCRQLESLSLISGGKHELLTGDINDIDANERNKSALYKSLSDMSLSQLDELLPHLKQLCLKNLDITDRTLESLERLSKLRSLRLDTLPGLTFDGVQDFMANATQINRLEVVNCLKPQFI